MGPFSDSAGAAAFWIFIAIVALGGIVKSALQHHETQKTIRQSIAAGKPIEPALLESAMLDRVTGGGDRNPGSLMLGGLIVIAVGLGLAIMGYFIGLDDGEPVYPLYGVAILVSLIGVAIGGFGVWAYRLGGKQEAPKG